MKGRLRNPPSIKWHIERVVRKLRGEVINHYRNRLISFAIFGSYARETYRHDSDLDVLIIADRLPKGRMNRMAEFLKIERGLERILEDLRKKGIFVELSPVIKSPSEAFVGSPLFIDMVEDVRVLYDRNDFLKNILSSIRQRLESYGARRIWKGNAWYWDLKPDYKPGDTIEI